MIYNVISSGLKPVERHMYIFLYKTDNSINKTAHDCNFHFFLYTLHPLQKQPKKEKKGIALDILNTA